MGEFTDQLAEVLREHRPQGWNCTQSAPMCSCGDGGEYMGHVAAVQASVLSERFVLVPKDQLHQQWGYSDDEDPDELFGWFGEGDLRRL